MKRILKTLVCASIFFISPTLFLNPASAQITHSDQGAVDKTADALLKKAASKFGNVSFKVTATILDGQKHETMKQTAQVLYCKGCYHLTVADQEVISDGKTVWQWNKSAKEVAINNVSNDDVDLLNPARLLLNYGKSFRAKYIRTDDDGTAIIDLQPRSARSFHKIRLFLVEESGLLRRMEVHKYDSGREIYDISGFKKASTPASQFTFDTSKHPEVEVIDMR
ncbi:MAG: outer-membrane lipoprotein carrier protein LolA [Bacteroidales bacterium]|nr:outer-membrane lipoprotein carrier protein LolA [Bacteroidales bacterium]